jgi:hypothetical protein
MPEVYEEIAEFTEGIPRNVNNFCFNALSLAYALQKRVVDMEVFREVVSDLDISKLTSPPGMNDYMPSVVNRIPDGAFSRGPADVLSPADAAAYMQDLALKLRNWQRSSENNVGGMQRNVRTSVEPEGSSS